MLNPTPGEMGQGKSLGQLDSFPACGHTVDGGYRDDGRESTTLEPKDLVQGHARRGGRASQRAKARAWGGLVAFPCHEEVEIQRMMATGRLGLPWERSRVGGGPRPSSLFARDVKVWDMPVLKRAMIVGIYDCKEGGLYMEFMVDNGGCPGSRVSDCIR